MSAPWYAVSDPRADAAWEVYHENSKRGPNDGRPLTRTPPPRRDHAGLPVLPLAEPTTPKEGPQPPAASPSGMIAGVALSGLLAAGLRPFGDDDPVEGFVAIGAVESLPRALAWFDATHHRLVLLRRDDGWTALRAALSSPAILDRAAALILLVGHLDRATAAAGERGYRDALIATGRHLQALETAAASLALRLEPVAFHDRSLDEHLRLDGLAESVLAVVALANGRS